MLSKHSKKLLEEAIKDLEVECYNKAASASYFALRRACEDLLLLLGERIPRRDDKLANAIRNKGLVEVAETLRVLYQLRKIADYGDGVSREEAYMSVEKAKRAIEIIEELIKRVQSTRHNK
ncbi:MAG: HEPN domain-containing protein [Sulfolobales archaeon]